MRIGVHKLLMSSPNDVSGLERMIDAGTIDPREIVALIGKTRKDNGGANDFTQRLRNLSLSLALRAAWAARPKTSPSVSRSCGSGGTEGVLSPGTRRVPAQRWPAIRRRRQAARARNGHARLRAPEEVGTMAEVREVAAATKKARAEAGITSAKDVHYVQVKGPLLTPAAVADADSRGAKLVTRDPNGSKPYARGATALGVALALREVAEASLGDAAIAQRLDLFLANTSAGGELRNCEVLLFGNSETAGGDLRIGHAVLRDAIDADGVRAAIAGCKGDPKASIDPAQILRHLRQGGSAAQWSAARPAHDDAIGCRHQL